MYDYYSNVSEFNLSSTQDPSARAKEQAQRHASIAAGYAAQTKERARKARQLISVIARALGI